MLLKLLFLPKKHLNNNNIIILGLPNGGYLPYNEKTNAIIIRFNYLS